MNRNGNFKSFPWLFCISSIIIPISSIASGIDNFYCGLLLASFLKFLFGLLIASLVSPIISLTNYRLRKKIAIALLILALAASVTNLIEVMIPSQKFIIEATVKTCQTNEDEFPFFIGWLFGSMIGFGTGFWIKNLNKLGLSRWMVILVPLLANILVLAASISISLQGITYVSFLLFAIGSILPLVVHRII